MCVFLLQTVLHVLEFYHWPTPQRLYDPSPHLMSTSSPAMVALVFIGNFSWIARAHIFLIPDPLPPLLCSIRYPPHSQTNATPMECWTPWSRKDEKLSAWGTSKIPLFLCRHLRLQYLCYRTSRGTKLFRMQLSLNQKYLGTTARRLLRSCEKELWTRGRCLRDGSATGLSPQQPEKQTEADRNTPFRFRWCSHRGFEISLLPLSGLPAPRLPKPSVWHQSGFLLPM